MIAFCLVSSDHGSMIVNRMDYNTSFNGNYYGVGAQILETGHYDQPEVEMLKGILSVRRDYYKDGVVALDGGANIGVHTVEFARHMRGWGAVLAFEAQERLFYALAGNIALQNCGNARAIWAALSDTCGEMGIPTPDYTVPSSFGSFELRQKLGTENIGQDIDYSKPTGWVDTLAIDSMELPRLDLLKLDIEGMEMEALSGAVETIKRCKPVMFIEVIKVDKAQLGAFLGEFGYRLYPHGMNVLAIHRDDKTAQHINVEARKAA